MPFEESKLASGVFAARRAVDPENAALSAQELTQAILHFLNKEHGGGVPATSEIFETVVKVLREMGQSATAEAYFNFHRDRRIRRGGAAAAASPALVQPSLFDPQRPPAVLEQLEKTNRWEKSELAAMLVEEAELPDELAREIAAVIDAKLAALDFPIVESGLVRELIAAELLRRGMESARLRPLRYGPSAEEIAKLIQANPSADAVYRRAGRSVLADYAIDHCYSADIAGLCREGLLELFDASAPGHWAAISLGAVDLAARCECVDEFLDRLVDQFADLASRTEGIVAIEAFDAIVALLERSPAEAGNLAEICLRALDACVRNRNVQAVVNLHACIPDGLADALGEGPLFAIRATEQQERLAARLCRELVEQWHHLAGRLENLHVDFHPDLRADPEDFCLGVRPYIRHFLASGRFRVAFDRGGIWLADGLPFLVDGPVPAQRVEALSDRPEGGSPASLTTPARRSAIYTAVGLRFDRLLDSLADERDQSTFVERLGLLTESAVRAGIQKRELIRRRQPELFAGRDFERAAILLVPIGLDEVVRRTLGKSLAESAESLALARQYLQAMAQRARRAARPVQIGWRIGGHSAWSESAPGQRCVPWRMGLTPAENSAGIRHQLFASGQLHELFGDGTAWCRVPPEQAMSGDAWVDALRFAAYESGTRRATFLVVDAAKQQAIADDWFRGPAPSTGE